MKKNNRGLVTPMWLVSSSNHFGTNQESAHTLRLFLQSVLAFLFSLDVMRDSVDLLDEFVSSFARGSMLSKIVKQDLCIWKPYLCVASAKCFISTTILTPFRDWSTKDICAHQQFVFESFLRYNQVSIVVVYNTVKFVLSSCPCFGKGLVIHRMFRFWVKAQMHLFLMWFSKHWWFLLLIVINKQILGGYHYFWMWYNASGDELLSLLKKWAYSLWHGVLWHERKVLVWETFCMQTFWL
jgi:hypothetical protein